MGKCISEGSPDFCEWKFDGMFLHEDPALPSLKVWLLLSISVDEVGLDGSFKSDWCTTVNPRYKKPLVGPEGVSYIEGFLY